MVENAFLWQKGLSSRNPASQLVVSGVHASDFGL